MSAPRVATIAARVALLLAASGCADERFIALPGFARSGLATAVVALSGPKVLAASPLVLHDEAQAARLELGASDTPTAIVAVTWRLDVLAARLGELPDADTRAPPLVAAESCDRALPTPDERAVLEGNPSATPPRLGAEWIAERCPTDWGAEVRVTSDCSSVACSPGVSTRGPCGVALGLTGCGYAGALRVGVGACVSPETAGCDAPVPLEGGGSRITCSGPGTCTFDVYDRLDKSWLGAPTTVKLVDPARQPPQTPTLEINRSWSGDLGYLGPLVARGARRYVGVRGVYGGRVCGPSAGDALVVLDAALRTLAIRPVDACVDALAVDPDGDGVLATLAETATLSVARFDVDGREVERVPLAPRAPIFQGTTFIGDLGEPGREFVAVTDAEGTDEQAMGVRFVEVRGRPLVVRPQGRVADYDGDSFAWTGAALYGSYPGADALVVVEPTRGRLDDWARLPGSISYGIGQLAWHAPTRSVLAAVPNNGTFVAKLDPSRSFSFARPVDMPASPLVLAPYPPAAGEVVVGLLSGQPRLGPEQRALLARMHVGDARILPGAVDVGFGAIGHLVLAEEAYVLTLPWSGEVVSIPIVSR